MGRSGFTIVGTLISAAMMGGLSLLLADLTKKQYIVQRKAEIELEITILMNRMVRVLYNGQACNNTLGVGQNLVETPPRTIGSILDKDGDVVFNEAQKYGNGLVLLESMTLDNLNITGTAGEVDLEVVLSKESVAITGPKKVTKVLTLSVEVSSGTTNLVNCQYTGENLDQIISDVVVTDVDPIFVGKASTAKQSFCTMLGGTFNATATPPCSFTATTTPVIPDISRSQHFAPPIVDTTMTCFCSKREYTCVPMTASSYAQSCGIKPTSQDTGSLASPRASQVDLNACYRQDAANHPYQTASSPNSCADARTAAKALVDPNGLANIPVSTVEPQGHPMRKVYCDSSCSYDGSNYTIGCRAYIRGKMVVCDYDCKIGEC